MAGEVTVTQMNGLLKKVYDSKLSNVVPASAILQRRIGFKAGKKVGSSYEVGVLLQNPNGFTYAGSSGDVVTLKQARNAIIKAASLTPFEMDLREQVAWAALSRAAQEGEQAIKSLTSELLLAMKVSAANRIEASMLHGQRGYGTVETVTDNLDGTASIVITAVTWAPGLWQAIGPNSTWDAFTGVTKNNASGALVLQRVVSSTRTIVITWTGTLASEIAAGDVLYPEGAYTGSVHNEMPGLLLQNSNTTGTSLGLSATTYTNWAGNLVPVGGADFSHGLVEDLLSVVRDRGVEGMLAVYVSNKAFSVLATELAGLRMLDSSYTPEKGKNGFKSLSYFSADVGDVTIVNHPFMRQTELLINPDDSCDRVGSSDITFGIPGMPDGMDLVQYLPDTNAAQFGMFSDQGVINKKPSNGLVATGFGYS